MGTRTLDDTLDVDQLVQRCMGSLQLAERLLRLYDTQLDTDIDVIRTAIAEGAVDRLASAAHRIKGGAANLGAASVNRVAAEIERRARTGETGELLPLVRVLEECHAQVREQFAQGNLFGNAAAGDQRL